MFLKARDPRTPSVRLACFTDFEDAGVVAASQRCFDVHDPSLLADHCRLPHDLHCESRSLELIRGAPERSCQRQFCLCLHQV